MMKKNTYKLGLSLVDSKKILLLLSVKHYFYSPLTLFGTTSESKENTHFFKTHELGKVLN